MVICSLSFNEGKKKIIYIGVDNRLYFNSFQKFSRLTCPILFLGTADISPFYFHTAVINHSELAIIRTVTDYDASPLVHVDVLKGKDRHGNFVCVYEVRQ